METTGDGTFFEEGDQVRLKRTGETGRINATAGGVVYVLMDTTNESRLFAAYVDEDAAIELVAREDATDEHDAIPFSVPQSEHWLLERTYHAHLRNGSELSVPNFTKAMKQITNFSVPLATWQEISQKEAHVAYRHGIPILLYGENVWQHPKGASLRWSTNSNIHALIFGNVLPQPEAISGTDYAVRYLDASRGHFSNASWRTWFASDSATIFDGSDLGTMTFLRPSHQFPYTTHYTVMASDDQVHEYADRAGAIQGFQALPLQEGSTGSAGQTVVFPQLCYYHEVTCPSGVYRLEFFGPRMDEQGYLVKESALSGREKTSACTSKETTVCVLNADNRLAHVE